MSAKGTVDTFLLPGLHQGRVMRIRESLKKMAYLVDIRTEVQVEPGGIHFIGHSNLELEIPFNDSATIFEFGQACGLERPVTKKANLKMKSLEGCRPLMLVRSEPELAGGDVEVVLFLRCRELQFESWA